MNHVYKVIFEPISHLTKVVDEYCHAHHGSSSVSSLTSKTSVTKAARTIHKEHPVRSALLDALHSVHVPHLSRHEFLALTEALALLGMVCLPVAVNAETEKEELQRLRSQVNELQKQVEILIKKGTNESVVIGINSSEQKATGKNSISIMAGDAKGENSKTDIPWKDSDKALPGVFFDNGKWVSNSTKTDPIWKPTAGSVSIGKGEGKNEITRRIIHVAAGYNDTDAVNVAQLKTIQGKVGEISSGNAGVDYRLVGSKNNNGSYTDPYSIDGYGNVKLNVQNRNDSNQVEEVTIEGIASRDYVNNKFIDGVNTYKTENGDKIAFNLRDQVTLGGHEKRQTES